MTGPPLIPDADGLDALTEQPPPEPLRALLAETLSGRLCCVRRQAWGCGPGQARQL